MDSSTHINTDVLFQPIQVGNMTLGHRVAMAPLTRFRSDAGHVPHPHVIDYYTQRASVPGTLIITEATFIAPQAGGYGNVPGIWSKEQIEAWRKITDSVHAKKSYIYLQLWALGRAAYPSQLKREGDLPYVSSSPIPLSDRPSTHPAPRALTIEEIKQYVEWYGQAAENAILAGFDGVEIHGANGYLVDQFTQDVCNKRTDEYGGSIENRTRFALEVVDAVVRRVGQKRAAIRISPWATYQGMGMKDPIPTFKYLVNELRDRFPDLAYLHTVEKRIGGDTIADDFFVQNGQENDFIRKLWTARGKRLITAGGYTRESAAKAASEKGDIVAFGRLFISNPDLPYKLKKGLPVSKGDRSRYYTKGTDPRGYTDYPFSAEFTLENREKSRL
ncbi:FMN-linked oxidoreductase [Panaeolus papilionaceus]|nr:FMN-linked oxidoreductase [Panaeolus papilionaceus]